MFTVYHSNQPKYFKDLLINVMSEQLLSDPMHSEIIIAENEIMIEWIQIELAKHFGIASNIAFMNLTVFIKKISHKISSNNFIMNDFNRSIMYWKFMKILSQKILVNKYSIIKEYLFNDIDQRKCGQFSEKLVELFTKYLIYHPDWLEHWKFERIVDCINDSHQLWQSEIWRILLKYFKKDNKILYENINYLQYCVYLLKNKQKINENIPKRIFIFGIVWIPPIYWEILDLLSSYIDIYLWFVSPYYKFDHNNIINKNLFSFKSLNSNQEHNIKKSKFYFSINHKLIHPLLDSCGAVSHNTLYSLIQINNLLEKKFFSIPKENSLLHILQKNILEFQNYVVIKKNKYNNEILKNHPKYILELDDQSITCHSCCSIQREVEVLHNNLLLMLQEDSLLLQKGIIVMTPNICNYTATIQTVFNNIYGRNLPFVIANDREQCIHPIASAFLNILNISYSRSTSEEILSFLTVPLIAARFNIDEEEIKILHKWITTSGIKWGLDDMTAKNLNLPITAQNTWNFGLNRILLGYSMRNQSEETWEGILPYDSINEEYIGIISHLGEFLKTLQKWRDRLSYSHTLVEWRSYITEILEDFFCCSNVNDEEYKILSLLKDCWKNILEPGIQSGYSKIVNIIVLRDQLCHKLNKTVISHKFLPNSIIFCNITPMCYIPCKVICFLGMNGDAFPRNDEISFDFDLMKKDLYSNDYNLYNRDCYAFLSAFLLAQERIYISFIGNSIYDNTACEPSILIDILFEYIAQHFYLIGEKDLDISINLDHIRNHLYRRYNFVPFASENFILGSKNQSFASEWVSSANINVNGIISSGFNFIAPLSQLVINKISFYDLYNFYLHPVKTWFHKRLGVYFNKNILKSINNDEPFSINGLHLFDLNRKLVDYLMNNNDVSILYDGIRASGILPYGAFGELHWMKQYSEMKALTDRIKIHHLSEKFNLDIFLKFENITLTGQLNMVQKNGLIRWKPAHLFIKDMFLLWLEHLIYCALGGHGESRLFGINDMWHFPNLSESQAKEFLFILISGYLSGINTPLLLLYKSGGSWINQIFNWETRTISMELLCQKKAYYKLICAWKGVKYSLIEGEYFDPYFRMLMPYDLNEKNIKEITEIAKHYFLFPMQYRILHRK